VIVGGGFGGIGVARALRRAPVDLVLVGKANHPLFQPLLHQVATAALSPADIAWPPHRGRDGQRHLRARAQALAADFRRIDAARARI